MPFPLGPFPFKPKHYSPWLPKAYSHIIMKRNTLSPTSKDPIVYKSLKFVSKSKVSSEIHSGILTVIPLKKIKTKKQITDFQHIMVQNIYYNCIEGSIMKKYWTKVISNTSWANSKHCISMSDVKMLYRSPNPFQLNCNILLPLRLVPLTAALLNRYPTTLASLASLQSRL